MLRLSGMVIGCGDAERRACGNQYEIRGSLRCDLLEGTRQGWMETDPAVVLDYDIIWVVHVHYSSIRDCLPFPLPVKTVSVSE